MLHADNRRAVASGLTFRPVVETIRAPLEWDCRDGGGMVMSLYETHPPAPPDPKVTGINSMTVPLSFFPSSPYSVVLPSKCSLSASASSRVWWTTPSR
jgi:hypothetical protein